jgi:tRNA dimethylallyltransferase
VDLPIRLVAAMSPARTANPLEESIPGTSNPEPRPSPLVVVVLGPTGSGKTALSLALAERVNSEVRGEIVGEIVSCDSVAVYRGLELGTAKPTLAERERVPHHLVDVTTPDKALTAGEYSRLARTALNEIAERGRMPIVTGGTGLYLRALTEGLFAGPVRHEDLRARLRESAKKHGGRWLRRMLTRLDAKTAERIHANDTPKLIRAIEVCVAARSPLSILLQNQGKNPLTGFRLLRIGLDPPRAKLYERLNERCAAMFSAGLVEETRGLLAQYGEVKALDSLGYRQARRVLDGSLSVEAAITAAQQGHRNYAKRQMTWFRREPEVEWIAGFGDEAETVRTARKLVESALTRLTD